MIKTKQETFELMTKIHDKNNKNLVKNLQAVGKQLKKKKLTGDTKKTFEKYLECHFESVSEVQQGRSKMYSLGAQRNKPLTLEENRGAALAGRVELNSLLIDYILNEKNNTVPMALSSWGITLGVLNRDLHNLRYNENFKKGVIKQLKKEFATHDITDENIAKAMLDDFIERAVDNILSAIRSVINQMEAARLITVYKTWKCKETSGNTRDMTENEIKKVSQLRHDLMTKHGIKRKDLPFKFKKEVVAYRKELGGELNNMKIEYYYETLDLTFCVGMLDIENYLKNCHIKGGFVFLDGEEDFIIATQNKYIGENRNRQLKLAIDRGNLITKSDSVFVRYTKEKECYAYLWEVMLNYFDMQDTTGRVQHLQVLDEHLNVMIKID